MPNTFIFSTFYTARKTLRRLGFGCRFGWGLALVSAVGACASDASQSTQRALCAKVDFTAVGRQIGALSLPSGSQACAALVDTKAGSLGIYDRYNAQNSCHYVCLIQTSPSETCRVDLAVQVSPLKVEQEAAPQCGGKVLPESFF